MIFIVPRNPNIGPSLILIFSFIYSSVWSNGCGPFSSKMWVFYLSITNVRSPLSMKLTLLTYGTG